MRLAAFLLVLLGAWFSASFFGVEPAVVSVPAHKVFLYCGLAILVSLIFTVAERAPLERIGLGGRYRWLTRVALGLSAFLLGASLTRLVGVAWSAGSVVVDPLAAVLLSLALSFIFGHVLGLIVFKALNIKSREWVG